jgi:hypothetical protein
MTLSLMDVHLIITHTHREIATSKKIAILCSYSKRVSRHYYKYADSTVKYQIRSCYCIQHFLNSDFSYYLVAGFLLLMFYWPWTRYQSNHKLTTTVGVEEFTLTSDPKLSNQIYFVERDNRTTTIGFDRLQDRKDFFLTHRPIVLTSLSFSFYLLLFCFFCFFFVFCFLQI